jgi:hypothetical protein
MIIYSALLGTLLLALLSIAILWPRRGIVQTLPTIFVGTSLGLFTYLYGPWFFLTVYAKYVFAFAMVGLFAIYAIRRGQRPLRRANRPRSVRSVIIGIIISVLIVLYFTGTNGIPYGVADMPLPFKKGSYLVLQGGNGLPTNLFHYNLRRSTQAMDIVKLNKWGNRASEIFSNNLHRYAIYGDTIYSPCDGVVTEEESSNPDNKPGIIKRGPKNTNFVMIDAPDYYVLMAHFMPGSLMVPEGSKVAKGQPIALVGNSGYSLEPHLHIQVMTKDNAALPWYLKPQLRILFEGRRYFLFQEIDAKPF